MTDAWDVAVVGAGTAGMPVAICAAQRGARVLLLDAAPQVGGALHLSSGSAAAAGGERQRARGIEDSPARHLADCLRVNHGTGDQVKLKTWVEAAQSTLDWLVDNGLDVGADQPQINPAHEPYDVARIYTPPKGGLSYLDCLKPMLDPWIAKGRISLHLSIRMTDLITDEQGAVTGLVASAADGETIRFAARKVVLASGGYAQSAKYWRELHGLPRRVYAYPHANGDGLAAARELGAQTAHAEHFLPTVGGTVDIDKPGDYWIHTRSSPLFRTPMEIFVNLDGRRFMAEDRPGPDRRERVLSGQKDMGFWAIYDEAIRREPPSFFLWPPEKVERAFRYHEDFQRADTLDGLAKACNLDASALRTTIGRYNAGQAVGSDEFERRHLPAPISEPPFYAVRHHGIAVITFAGLVTDQQFGVLRQDGAPIPNLHAVGEVLGAGMFGNAYLGGMMVSSALTFGRLLGENLSW